MLKFTLLLIFVASIYSSKVTYFVKHQPDNIEKLHKILKEVSDPDSQKYGQFLSHEQVIELQRPLKMHTKMVEDFLSELGYKYETSIAGDKIVADIPEHLTFTESKEDHIKKQNFMFPQILSESVDNVSGFTLGWKLDQFDQKVIRNRNNKFLSKINNQLDKSSCLQDFVTPNCIKKTYGLEGYTGTESSNKQMVIVNQSYMQDDLSSFFSKYQLSSQTVEKNIGSLSGKSDLEATLDMEYIMTTGEKVPTWWFYINGHIDNPFADWITWSSNNKDIPYVHSLSVGGNEQDFADSNGGDAGLTRVNNELTALGARGISILFASGDSGYKPILNFGASSPFVTSIGGIFNGDMKNEPLQVDYISTGGISSMAPNSIQDYQKDSVAAYLKTKGQRPQKIDATKRFVPDISAYDDALNIVQGGKDGDASGTSAATPIVAGMISLLNDQLVKKGLTPLGFLNPFLYKNADAFLDIKRGGNNGIDAVEGYDPASGLGTFDSTTFKKLLDAAVKAKTKSIELRVE